MIIQRGQKALLKNNKGLKKTIYIDNDMKDLIPIYLNNRHKDIQAVFEALQNNTFPQIQTIGHNLKGTGESYGFSDITIIGKALEEAARAEDAVEVRKYINELVKYMESIEIVYK